MISLNDAYRPVDNTAYETVEGQTVIINLNSGTYFSLNATGSFLWERLDGKMTLKEISVDLAETWQVNVEITDPDVLALIQELEGEGLVEKALPVSGEG